VNTRSIFDEVWSLYLPVAVAVVVIVVGVIVFAVLRFRERPGRISSRRTENLPLEVVYVVILVVIAAVLYTVTYRADAREERTRSSALPITVIGYEWEWHFSYPGTGVSVDGTQASPPRLVVPLDTRIHFTLTSRDVIHAFWIPAMRFKWDAFPFRTTSFDMTFPSQGTLVGRCAEFCGLGHTGMAFLVDVVPKARYQAWIASGRHA
jgi:cytochrome c oxidase subunit 2